MSECSKSALLCALDVEMALLGSSCQGCGVRSLEIDSSSTFVDFFQKLKGTWEVLKTEFTICICGCGAAVVQNNLVLLP